jgi:hypothetical protein
VTILLQFHRTYTKFYSLLLVLAVVVVVDKIISPLLTVETAAALAAVLKVF